jgi:hypothetical protein
LCFCSEAHPRQNRRCVPHNQGLLAFCLNHIMIRHPKRGSMIPKSDSCDRDNLVTWLSALTISFDKFLISDPCPCCSAHAICWSPVKQNEFSGVSDVQTDVQAKTVVVHADSSVTPESMLEKLQKVSYMH